MIQYEFLMEDGSTHRFEVDPDRKYDGSKSRSASEWTQLGFHQCENCPLNAEEHKFCPTALDLEQIAAEFTDILSSDAVEVRVKSPQREYSKACSVQEGLNSLFGLVMATGGCPILSKLRGMAYCHLPFCSFEEVLIRSTGIYLIQQYLIRHHGGEPDWELDGLAVLYQELQKLNRNFTTRLRAASEKDANLNAVNTLFAISYLMKTSMDRELELLMPMIMPDFEPPSDGED